MRRFLRVLPVWLLGAGWLLALFAPLVSPERALANRDIPLFHLPLRLSFAALAEGGLPVWNPFLHGGQPILSNPSYAAFYPPSWLVLLVPTPYALNLLVLLHGAIAFAGAWSLARRLGARGDAAALAAVGYAGSGALLSLISAFTLFCSMAWFPWVLLHGDAALRAPERRAWLRPALLCGLFLALQLLNGEPATVLVSGLGLLALAAAALPRRPVATLRALVPPLVAVLLAAVQLVPTARRLADSPRSGGLAARQATEWSARPERLVELVFPRFFGDPTRDIEGLFFGGGLHDGGYPYVTSLYPGLLLAVLALSALARRPVPRRAAWALAVVGGAFLALGRFNPFYEALREAVPVFAMLRFPEKFAVLTVAALGFAGALGWDDLLRARDAGRPGTADLPLALSLVLLATVGGLAVLLHAAPDSAAELLRRSAGAGVAPADLSRGVLFLQGEARAAVLTAGAVAALLALCRWRRPSRGLLAALAVSLLGVDLWHYDRGLVKTLPADAYRDPPPLARLPRPGGGRFYVEPPREDVPRLVLRTGDPSTALARAALAHLDPYAGALWRVPYALHEDYDLMLTGWARRALAVFHQEWSRPEMAFRFLGIWNVGSVLVQKTIKEWDADLARDPAAPPMRAVANPFLLPRFRFVPRASFHGSYAEAVQAARAQGWVLHRHEHCVRPGAPPATAVFPGRPRTLEFADERRRVRLHYASEAPTLFTAAVTFDEGWRARVDGEPVALWPTAAGQMAVALPAGEHRLVLEYRQPLLATGAAVTLASFTVWAAGLWWLRRPAQRS